MSLEQVKNEAGVKRYVFAKRRQLFQGGYWIDWRGVIGDSLENPMRRVEVVGRCGDQAGVCMCACAIPVGTIAVSIQ